jgi:phosphate transport system permease protein
VVTLPLSEIRMRTPQTTSEKAPEVAAGTAGVVSTAAVGQINAPVSDIRQFLLSRGNSSIADRAFGGLMLACAISIFGIVVLIATELVMQSQMS